MHRGGNIMEKYREELRKAGRIRDIAGIALMLIGIFGIAGTVGSLETDVIGLLQALIQFAISFALGYVAMWFYDTAEDRIKWLEANRDRFTHINPYTGKSIM
jgi:hypothetical protein